MTQDVVILDGVRTAIGTFGGALAGHAPTTLAAAVAKEAIARSGVDPKQIGHAIFGHVINTEGRDMYLARVAAVEAGVPNEAPARAGHERQPALRIGRAGHRFLCPAHHAGRCRFRPCGWCRMHVALAIF